METFVFLHGRNTSTSFPHRRYADFNVGPYHRSAPHFNVNGFTGMGIPQTLINTHFSPEKDRLMLTVQDYDMIEKTLRVASSVPKNAATAEERLQKIMTLSDSDLIRFIKDPIGSKFMQDAIPRNFELYNKVYQALLRDTALEKVTKDQYGSFVVKVMLETTANCCESICEPFYAKFESASLNMLLNRWSCRVVESYLNVFIDRPCSTVIKRLLSQWDDNGFMIVTDQNANHVIQHLVDKTSPEVFHDFFKALISRTGEGGQLVTMDKYGCRVIQKCLEKVVKYSFEEDSCGEIEAMTKSKAILQMLMDAILNRGNIITLIEHEFANYIIQFILNTSHLKAQRKHIIKSCIMHNILWLSQGKYSSHVVEQALLFASPSILRAMFSEVLDGYEPDSRGQTALRIMLFDQFANYVVQRMLTIAIEVRCGIREGEVAWFDRLKGEILMHKRELEKYSSGKKILKMIDEVSHRERVPRFHC